MKILIAYVCVGAGHKKAAEAVYSYFKRCNKDVDLQILDILEKANFFYRKLYQEGYSILIRHGLLFWAFGFWLTQKKQLCGFIKRINLLINRLNLPGFLSLLIKENPDFVISTHFLASEIVAYLKNKHKIRSNLITIITDFGVHPFWVYKETTLYVVASELTKQELQGRGVAGDDIKVFGIPVSETFFKEYERSEICEKLGIDENRFTVLVVSGSFGIGPIERIVDLLYKEAQMLVVCSRNKRLYTHLKAKDYAGVSLFGFVDNIEELMAASSVIITKPGGLSISELLVKEIVPIFISPIFGQETENAKKLASYGIGVSINSPLKIREAVLDHKEHPDKILRIKETIKRIKKPYSAGELYDVICKSSAGIANRRSV